MDENPYESPRQTAPQASLGEQIQPMRMGVLIAWNFLFLIVPGFLFLAALVHLVLTTPLRMRL